MNKNLAAAFALYERDKDPDVFLATLQALCLRGDTEATRILIDVWDILCEACSPDGLPSWAARLMMDMLGVDDSTSIDYLRKGVKVYSWARN